MKKRRRRIEELGWLRNDEMFRSLDVITEVEWVKEHLRKKIYVFFFVCIKVERVMFKMEGLKVLLLTR
jgi:hypothetical protein